MEWGPWFLLREQTTPARKHPPQNRREKIACAGGVCGKGLASEWRAWPTSPFFRRLAAGPGAAGVRALAEEEGSPGRQEGPVSGGEVCGNGEARTLGDSRPISWGEGVPHLFSTHL